MLALRAYLRTVRTYAASVHISSLRTRELVALMMAITLSHL